MIMGIAQYKHADFWNTALLVLASGLGAAMHAMHSFRGRPRDRQSYVDRQWRPLIDRGVFELMKRRLSMIARCPKLLHGWAGMYVGAFGAKESREGGKHHAMSLEEAHDDGWMGGLLRDRRPLEQTLSVTGRFGMEVVLAFFLCQVRMIHMKIDIGDEIGRILVGQTST
jgi:hypothetical protein